MEAAASFAGQRKQSGVTFAKLFRVGCCLTFAECPISHDTLGCKFPRLNIIPGLGSRGRPQHTKQPLTICCRRTGRREAAAGRSSCCSGTCLSCAHTRRINTTHRFPRTGQGFTFFTICLGDFAIAIQQQQQQFSTHIKFRRSSQPIFSFTTSLASAQPLAMKNLI